MDSNLHFKGGKQWLWRQLMNVKWMEFFTVWIPLTSGEADFIDPNKRWSKTLLPSPPNLKLTCKVTHHCDSSLLTGIENTTCYQTREARTHSSLRVREFHYTSDSCESCWWNAAPKWGNQAAFWKTHLDAAAKPKLALLCSVLFPSQQAWCISEKLIQQQICWTNTVIIWSSGAFVIKLSYLCQKGRHTDCLEDDLLFLWFTLIKDTADKRDSCVFNWSTHNNFASKHYWKCKLSFCYNLLGLPHLLYTLRTDL